MERIVQVPGWSPHYYNTNILTNVMKVMVVVVIIVPTLKKALNVLVEMVLC